MGFRCSWICLTSSLGSESLRVVASGVMFADRGFASLGWLPQTKSADTGWAPQGPCATSLCSPAVQHLFSGFEGSGHHGIVWDLWGGEFVRLSRAAGASSSLTERV